MVVDAQLDWTDTDYTSVSLLPRRQPVYRRSTNVIHLHLYATRARTHTLAYTLALSTPKQQYTAKRAGSSDVVVVVGGVHLVCRATRATFTTTTLQLQLVFTLKLFAAPHRIFRNFRDTLFLLRFFIFRFN